MREFIKKSWKFILILCALTVIATWISIPENLVLNIITSLLCLAVGIGVLYPQRENLYKYFTGRYFKNLSTNLFTLFIVALIISIINFMIYQRPLSFDVTKQKVNTLSDQSAKLLAQLDGTLRIELYAKRSQWVNALSMLELLRFHKPSITIEAYDIEKDLMRAKSANITENNSIRLIYKGKEMVTKLHSELSITNALIRLLRAKPFKIAFSKSHNEVALDQKGNAGIRYLLEGLINFNSEIRNIDLTKAGRIADDLIMILGPTVDFDLEELDRLEEFLLSGGKLFVALDPDFKTENLENLRRFLADWGFKVRRDVVVDKMSTIEGVDASVIVTKKFNKQHVITKDFQGRILFPLSSSIQLTGKNGYKQDHLIFSSAFPASWAESNLASLSSGKVFFDNEDLKGPVTIAAVMQKNIYIDKRMRMAVFSSSRFLLDGYRNQSVNYNLLMNTVTWLVEEDRLLSLDRPGLVQERIFMSKTQMNLIFYFSIIFLPLLLMGIGIFIYRKKQRL
jgi:ABC-type uncharacterized transport system involved in gliding motility auxiliary subunit